MAKMPAPKVGDQVTLPSGRTLKITVAAVPERPWAAIKSTWHWHVCREHGLGRASVSFYFDPVRRHPVLLSEADAKALAEILNRVR